MNRRSLVARRRARVIVLAAVLLVAGLHAGFNRAEGCRDGNCLTPYQGLISK